MRISEFMKAAWVALLVGGLAWAAPASADPPATQPDAGLLRPAGERWPFRNGDRVHWSGASHTNIGLYVSVVEFYVRTRMPGMKIVMSHSSTPVSADAHRLAGVIEQKKLTVYFGEYGFYDTSDPARFVANCAAVAKACRDRNVTCIFLPTMWLAGATRLLDAEYQAAGADPQAINAARRKAGTLTKQMMMAPEEIHGPYFRCKKGLSLDATMAARKAWGDENGVLVLETYADQADWAKAQWARNPKFVFLSGSTPHPLTPGYLCVGFFALERLQAPIVQSRLAVTVAGQEASVREAVNCQASELAVADGGLRFKRLDKVLPVVPPLPVRDLPADPAPVLKLSPWFLTVSGLADGQYEIAVAGQLVGRATAAELAAGVNLNAVYLASGQGRQPKFPWRRLWDAVRGNTMDNDYVPTADDDIGKSAWPWEVRPVKE